MATTLSISLIVLYLIAVKIIAYRAHRDSKAGPEDFFVVGRSLGGPMLWSTIIATIINGLAFSAVPGLVYHGGVVFLQMWVVVAVTPFLIRTLGPAIADYGRRNGLFSQGEIFGRFYNSKTVSILTGLIAIVSVIPFMTIQLSAMAKITAAASDGVISYTPALLLFAASTGLYIIFGGARAVVRTDMLQAACFIVLFVVSALLFLSWSGGLGASLRIISERRPELLFFNSVTGPTFIDNVLSWPLAFFLWPQLFQRMFMAKSNAEIVTASKATFAVFAFIMLMIMTLGITATAHFIDGGASPDTLIAEMYAAHFPLGSSFIVLAVVASSMSTVDSGLLAVTAAIARDFRVPEQAVKPRLIALALLTAVAYIALSKTGRGSIAPLVTFGASFAALFLWPVLGMTFLKSIDYRGVIGCYAAGTAGILLASAGVFSPFGAGTAGFIFAGAVFSLYALRSQLPAAKVTLQSVCSFTAWR